MPLFYTKINPFTALHIGPKTNFLMGVGFKSGAALVDMFPTESTRQSWLQTPDDDALRKAFSKEIGDVKISRNPEESLLLYGTPLTIEQAEILEEIMPIDFVLKLNISAEFWMSPNYWPHPPEWNNQFRDMRVGLEKRLDMLEEKYSDLFDPITEYYRERKLLIEISEDEIRQDQQTNFDAAQWVGKRGILGKKDCIINAIEDFWGPVTEEIPYISDAGKRLMAEKEERERESEYASYNAPL